MPKKLDAVSNLNQLPSPGKLFAKGIEEAVCFVVSEDMNYELKNRKWVPQTVLPAPPSLESSNYTTYTNALNRSTINEISSKLDQIIDLLKEIKG